MIEIASETLISVRQVPQELPERPNGKRVHVDTVRRWMNSGIRDIQLESVRIGGTTYTSKEALQRFADKLSDAVVAASPPRPLTVTRRREIERAARELEKLLGIKR